MKSEPKALLDQCHKHLPRFTTKENFAKRLQTLAFADSMIANLPS